MNNLENELKETLSAWEETISEEISEEMMIYIKIVEFANWLDEGVKVTNDPLLKKVLDNFIGQFSDYLQETKENK